MEPLYKRYGDSTCPTCGKTHKTTTGHHRVRKSLAGSRKARGLAPKSVAAHRDRMAEQVK